MELIVPIIRRARIRSFRMSCEILKITIQKFIMLTYINKLRCKFTIFSKTDLSHLSETLYVCIVISSKYYNLHFHVTSSHQKYRSRKLSLSYIKWNTPIYGPLEIEGGISHNTVLIYARTPNVRIYITGQHKYLYAVAYLVSAASYIYDNVRHAKIFSPC